MHSGRCIPSGSRGPSGWTGRSRALRTSCGGDAPPMKRVARPGQRSRQRSRSERGDRRPHRGRGPSWQPRRPLACRRVGWRSPAGTWSSCCGAPCGAARIPGTRAFRAACGLRPVSPKCRHQPRLGPPCVKCLTRRVYGPLERRPPRQQATFSGPQGSRRRSYAVNSAERRLVGEVDGRLFRARAAAVLAHVAREHVGLLVVVSPFVGGDQAWAGSHSVVIGGESSSVRRVGADVRLLLGEQLVRLSPRRSSRSCRTG